MPDSTLLLAGLDLLTGKALSKFPETQFRLSSFRYSQNIDMVPTSEKVCALAEMLQAELEVLDTGVAKGTKAARLEDTTEPPKGKPKAKAKAACKHWMTPGGCRFAGSCTFAHSPLGRGTNGVSRAHPLNTLRMHVHIGARVALVRGTGGVKGRAPRAGRKALRSSPRVMGGQRLMPLKPPLRLKTLRGRTCFVKLQLPSSNSPKHHQQHLLRPLP